MSRKGPLPRSSAPRPTILLGLFSWDLRLARGVILAGQALGWRFLNLGFSDGRVPPYAKPRGAIVDLLYDAPRFAEMRSAGYPVVRLGRLPHPADDRMPAVLPDFAAAGRLAATHLAERGFRHLGFLGYHDHDAAAAMRDAYETRARELGRTFHLLEVGDESGLAADRQEQRVAREQAWLLSMPRPFAVFTYSDLRAGQICSACLGAGLSVPDEAAILGYGDVVEFCQTAPVGLSSVDPDQALLGRKAVSVLQRIMDGKAAPGTPVMVQPGSVVHRQSTDVLAVPHAGVAKALRFIWGHLDQPLSVPDIARAAGMSRTGLNDAFRRHLGRSVNAELQRKRLERCTGLLRSSQLSVAQIAAATGFSTRTYLYRAFRKAHGMTPRQYRLQHRQD